MTTPPSGLLAGKVAIVTGAGRGIGRAMAMAIASEGASVLVNDLGTDPEGRLAEDSGPASAVAGEITELGGVALANSASVADFDDAGRMVGQAIEAWGTVDILVNAAGVARRQSIFSVDPADWHGVLAVNLHGTFHLSRLVAPIMRRAGSGAVLNTCSDSFTGAWGTPAYAAAKAGVWSLTNAIASEGAPYGIRANCIAPIAETRLQDYARETQRLRGEQPLPAALAHNFDAVPGPEYVGPVAAFMVSELAAGMTGRMVSVRGRDVGLWSVPTVESRLPNDASRSDPWTPQELSRYWNDSFGIEVESGPDESAEL